MHPDDQFEAFRQLVDAGRGVEEVSARFGVSSAVVERRLKLARVSPKLRAAFREGDLTLDQMMAFAVSDDHGQQEEIYAGFTHWSRSPRDIRAALTQEAVALTQPLAKFVGLEAYVAAGGIIQLDLFDEGNEGYLVDRALVMRLAQEKLEAAAETVKAEGWKWAKVEMERDYSIHYGRVFACSDNADEDGSEPDSRYTEDDMARAGVILRIGYDGELTVDWGLVHPDDLEKRAWADVRKPEKQPGDVPVSLIRDLSAHRTAALQAALARNPAIALAATVTALALTLFYSSYCASCLDISVRPPVNCHGFVANNLKRERPRFT